MYKNKQQKSKFDLNNFLFFCVASVSIGGLVVRVLD
jgi:hypothetical protein